MDPSLLHLSSSGKVTYKQNFSSPLFSPDIPPHFNAFDVPPNQKPTHGHGWSGSPSVHHVPWLLPAKSRSVIESNIDRGSISGGLGRAASTSSPMTTLQQVRNVSPVNQSTCYRSNLDIVMTRDPISSRRLNVKDFSKVNFTQTPLRKFTNFKSYDVSSSNDKPKSYASEKVIIDGGLKRMKSPARINLGLTSSQSSAYHDQSGVVHTTDHSHIIEKSSGVKQTSQCKVLSVKEGDQVVIRFLNKPTYPEVSNRLSRDLRANLALQQKQQQNTGTRKDPVKQHKDFNF